MQPRHRSQHVKQQGAGECSRRPQMKPWPTSPRNPRAKANTAPKKAKAKAHDKTPPMTNSPD
eukprot:6477530-Pyramimonas_sp.AAC.1